MLLLLACTTSEPEPAPAPKRRPNLVLVTLDTTRADRMGAYGHEGAQTPVFDAFAAQGARFDRAYTTVPLTIPAHSSMFTGLYPPRHGVHDNGSAILADHFTTLAERLRDAGWSTGASVGAFVTTRAWNLDQGFDAYFDAVGGQGRWSQERPAREVVDDAIGWVQEQRGPFFLWVHVYDAHDPYAPPEPTEGLEERPYDAEIAYVDQQIGRLRDAIDTPTAWMLVGDHGEALGEHGERTHGLLLFESVVRVPFVITSPEGQPAVVDTPVSVVDVLPTGLGLMGLEPPPELDGVDLSGALSGGALPTRQLYMESWTAWLVYGFHPEVALVEGPWKWMATPSSRLFNVVEDPAEATDRTGEHTVEPSLLARLEEQEVGGGDSLALDPAVRAQLDALGYLGGSDAAPWREVDVKDRMGDIQALRQPSPDQEAKLRVLLERDPEFNAARGQLARLLLAEGEHEEALSLYEAMVASTPTNLILRVNHAAALGQAGRPDDALAVLHSVLEQLPEDNVARGALLEVLLAAGRTEEALAQAEQWHAQDPEDVDVMAWTGLLRVSVGRVSEGQALLESSLQDGVPRPQVNLVLARIADGSGQPEEAIAYLEAELSWFPDSAEAHMLLGRARMMQSRWEEAIADFSRALDLRPNDVEAHRGRAQAAFNTGDYALCEEYLRPALERAPEDPEVLLLLANLQDKQGRSEEATATFERAKEAKAALR